jgi:hypothetical protein
VNGRVRIAGVGADVETWTSDQIRVGVPRTVREQNHGTIEVVVADRVAERNDVRVSCQL